MGRRTSITTHDGYPPEDRTEEILNLLADFYAKDSQAVLRRLADERRAETTRRRESVSRRLAVLRRRLGEHGGEIGWIAATAIYGCLGCHVTDVFHAVPL